MGLSTISFKGIDKPIGLISIYPIITPECSHSKKDDDGDDLDPITGVPAGGGRTEVEATEEQVEVDLSNLNTWGGIIEPTPSLSKPYLENETDNGRYRYSYRIESELLPGQSTFLSWTWYLNNKALKRSEELVRDTLSEFVTQCNSTQSGEYQPLTKSFGEISTEFEHDLFKLLCEREKRDEFDRSKIMVYVQLDHLPDTEVVRIRKPPELDLTVSSNWLRVVHERKKK